MIAYDESNIVGPDVYHLPKKGAMLWVQGEDRLIRVTGVQFQSGAGLYVLTNNDGVSWPPSNTKVRCRKEDLLPVTEETDDFKLYDLVVLKPEVAGVPMNGVLMIGRLDTPNVYVHHTNAGYQCWVPRADLLKVVLPDYS